jgi:hypothetical protein
MHWKIESLVTAAGVAVLVLGAGTAHAQATPGYNAKIQLTNVSPPQVWDQVLYANVANFNDPPPSWQGEGGEAYIIDKASDPNGLNQCARKYASNWDPRPLLNIKEEYPSAMVIATTPDTGYSGSDCNNSPNDAEGFSVTLNGFGSGNCTETKGTGSVVYTWKCTKMTATFVNQSGNVDFLPVKEDYGIIDIQLLSVGGPIGGYQWHVFADPSDVDSDGNKNVMTANQLFPFPDPDAVVGM